MIFQSCLVAGCVSFLAPVILAAALLIFIVYGASSAMTGAEGAFDAYSVGSVSTIREKVLRRGEAGKGTIVVIAIQGVIGGGGSPLEGDGQLSWIADQVKAARENKEVKAIVLQVDSPGGGLTASDLIHNEVMKAKADGKKVIAWAGSLMASGGYYVALAADGIMASPTATIGSIGVILQHYELGDLLKTLGIRVSPVTSGAHKDIGSVFREMTPEERAILRALVDRHHARFVDLVREGRGMSREKAEALADGSIFTAEDAVANGLVDRIGYTDDAAAWAEKLAGEEGMRIIAYRRLLSLGDLFREAGRGTVEALRGEAGPRIMALWDASR